MRSAERSAPQPTQFGWPESWGRAQRGEQLQLGMRNLYILPTGFGILWLAGSALLQAVGIQTQRNGPLLLSFLMLGLMLLALHLTHFNLQGLVLRCGRPKPGFADETLLYPIRLQSSCQRQAIALQLAQGDPAFPRRLAAGSSCVGLAWQCRHRGQQTPGALLIRSTSPLGLFVCWTRWTPPVTQLVYPARRDGPVAVTSSAPADDSAACKVTPGHDGSDDWHDLRPHRLEDGQSRVAWKVLAQGRGRHSKVFSDPVEAPPLLLPAPGIPRERALEHLSAEVWRRSLRGEMFGLVLPEVRITPGHGHDHRDRCLMALASCP